MQYSNFALNIASRTKSQIAISLLSQNLENDPLLTAQLAKNPNISKQLWFHLYRLTSLTTNTKMIQGHLDHEQIEFILKDKRITLIDAFFTSSQSGIRTISDEQAKTLLTQPFFTKKLARKWLNAATSPLSIRQDLVDLACTNFDYKNGTVQRLLNAKPRHQLPLNPPPLKPQDVLAKGANSDYFLNDSYEHTLLELLENSLDPLGPLGWETFLSLSVTWELTLNELLQTVKYLAAK